MSFTETQVNSIQLSEKQLFGLQCKLLLTHLQYATYISHTILKLFEKWGRGFLQQSKDLSGELSYNSPVSSLVLRSVPLSHPLSSELLSGMLPVGALRHNPRFSLSLFFYQQINLLEGQGRNQLHPCRVILSYFVYKLSFH